MYVQNTSQTLTDEEVAALVQGGNIEEFGVLVLRYEDKLSRYGRRFLSEKEDIEDLVQEIFIKVFQNIQSFDLGQRFSPWIYRIAHNTFVNQLKKNSRNPFFIDFDALVAHPAYEDPQNSEQERQEMRKMIDLGLQKISPKYREVLILYYLEEVGYKEIGDILEIPSGTVGVRLRRAKAALAEVYKKMNIPYGE